jgi:hypothetical protein
MFILYNYAMLRFIAKNPHPNPLPEGEGESCKAKLFAVTIILSFLGVGGSMVRVILVHKILFI